MRRRHTATTRGTTTTTSSFIRHGRVGCTVFITVHFNGSLNVKLLIVRAKKVRDKQCMGAAFAAAIAMPWEVN